ncbi:MAG: hypothetical protein QOJ94_1418 [Sphingomonadales bacterium]|jgi:SpoVK/Ycf46/Vps4 family AAA+-type ATPase|nr:hypothetical protein [Sphingomonadales bacterium]
MGEKLLAQRVIRLLRDTHTAGSPAARILVGWAVDHRAWLWPHIAIPDAEGDGDGVPLTWPRLGELTDAIATDEAEPAIFASLRAAERLLGLDGFDSALLKAAVGLARLPRLSPLRNRLASAGEDTATLTGRLAGAGAEEAIGRVRRSAALSLGLLQLGCDGGALDLTLDWSLSRLLERPFTDDSELIEALAGKHQAASLRREDFAEHAAAFDLLVRLLSGALREGARGVNILIHGPPGTGKTELAKALAEAAGGRLYGICEEDEEGEEPTRFQRLHALRRAQRLLAPRGDCLLLFDEMEDLFSDARETAGGGRRAGSKVFVNRLFEDNPVPTLWTSNAADALDSAHLRRMSFILRMDHPPARARARIVARAAEAEGTSAAASGLLALAGREPETASVARVAFRTAALAGGGAADAEAAGRSLILGLRGRRAFAPPTGGETLDLALYECDRDLASLVERVTAPGAPRDFSLLLTGPPGTGKTALAAHLAERLDRPLAVRRASDLLSKWVGETEANIADAFADAREAGAVLLFDEADSLLLDRADAQRSWEITQVNELLTWMDAHPLPFVAATNFARRLDPAALRRFVFKVELRPLSAEAATRAFELFFGAPAPAALAEVTGLTPGDFAVVRRQLRFRGASASEIVALLDTEARAKPERPARLGF